MTDDPKFGDERYQVDEDTDLGGLIERTVEDSDFIIDARTTPANPEASLALLPGETWKQRAVRLRWVRSKLAFRRGDRA
jgi:hypothetical protein